MGDWRTQPLVLRLYLASVCSRHRSLRLVGIAGLSFVSLVSTAPQFFDNKATERALLLLLLLAAEAALFIAPLMLVVAIAALAVALVLIAAGDKDDSTGHRGGSSGFDGQYCENTSEAAAALVARDASEGPLPHFPYLEFDVQECSDGELVVFHDARLVRAFPAGGPNATAVEQLEKQTGVPFQLLQVQDLTLAQLQSLHIGGRPGLHVPTLRQLLEACVAAEVRRSLAVEMKQLRSDVGRQRFIDTLIWYKETYGPRLDADPVALRQRCRRLGWVGVIAFPHLWAQSFGAFGSKQWRRWAAEFKARGIPVRACHATWLTLIGA